MFYGHHAKIVCLAWSPDNEHFASGGMDMMVYVWTLSDPETRVKIQGDCHTHRLPGSWPQGSSVPSSFRGGHPVKACLLPHHARLCWPELGTRGLTADAVASGLHTQATCCVGPLTVLSPFGCRISPHWGVHVTEASRSQLWRGSPRSGSRRGRRGLVQVGTPRCALRGGALTSRKSTAPIRGLSFLHCHLEPD